MAAAKRKQTREAYVDAVLEELAARGFQGLTVEAVVRRTGGSRGGFYHHFDNKLDALAQAFAAQTQRAIRHIEESLEGGASVEQAVTAMALRQLRETPAALSLAMVELHVLATRNADLRNVMVADHDAKLRYCTELLQHGIDSGELRDDIDARLCAHHIMMSRLGIYLDHFGTGQRGHLVDKMQRHMGLLFDALRRRPA